MDLIDRYLDTVRLLLPAAERDDITAELRDVLISRREEKETELGRPLTRQEDEALLRAFGNPLIVAARYGRPRYLIGPDLYPVYVLVMKVVLACIAVAALITGVVMTALAPANLHRALVTSIDMVWNGGFGAIGVVTVIFAVLQHTGVGERMMRNWKVDDLPRFSPLRMRRRRQDGWPRLVAAIAFQVLFLLWWTGVLPLWWADLPVDPHGLLHIAPAPIWHSLYPAVIGLSMGVIGVNASKLAGVQGRLAHALDIALNLAVGAVAAAALAAGRRVVVSGAAIAPAALAKIDRGIEIGLYVALIVTVLSSVIHVAIAGWRMLRPQAGQAARTA
jgi:hypothetical protein